MLFIDKRVDDLDVLLYSSHHDTSCIVVDYTTTTFHHLLETVSNLGQSKFDSVGWLSHSYSGSYIQFLGTQTKQMLADDLEMNDPEMDSWSELSTFFRTLQSTYGVKYVHLMMCEIARNENYVYAFNRLEEQTGLRFYTSEAKVGSSQLGGSWTIDGVSMIDEGYFTKDVEKYRHVLSSNDDYDSGTGGAGTSYYNDNGLWTASANTLSLSMATNALHYKYKISMSDDGTRLCVLNRTGAVRVNIYDLINGNWTLNTNSPVSLTTTTSDLNCAMSGNGQAFVIGANGINPEAYIENANGSWSLTYIATSLTQFLTCGLNYDGTKAVIASNDSSLKVWNFTISATSIETITSSPRQLFAGFGGDNCVICADDSPPNPFNEVNIFQKR